MVDPIPISGSPQIQQTAGHARQTGTNAPTSGQGVAFEALLEKLDGQARNIQKASEHVDRPDQLAGAVDQARSSLDQALSLGNQLIEAFRASQMQNSTGNTAPPSSGS